MIDTAAFFAFPEAGTWNQRFQASQARWIDGLTAPLEPLAMMLATSYVDAAKGRDYVAANLELNDATRQLIRHDLNLSWTDEELCRWCALKAEKVVQYLRAAEASDRPFTILRQVVLAQRAAKVYGLPVPSLKEKGPLGVLRRMVDPRWWRRGARTLQKREVEKLAIILRRVRKGREIYCSDETVRRRSAQRHRNRKYLESTTAENLSANADDGERAFYTLAELADLSISNPRIRRGELMMRIRGFDEVAQLLGHVREFWTMTAPSRFHRWTTAGQGVRENGKWDEQTPRNAQEWLTKAWSKIRAALGRYGVRLYGFRVVEAHHDGTPHWHAAMFYSPHWQDDERRAAAPRVRAIVRRYCLQEERKAAKLARAAAARADRRADAAMIRAEKARARVTPRAVKAAELASQRTAEALALVAVAKANRKDKASTAKALREAEAHRCDFKTIDPDKGDAAGYLAKYITKAIDATDAGDLVQTDLYGYDAGESARRVEAWAACWGIRQFQQIGGPSVTAWRELRRAMGREVTQADLFDAPKSVQLAAEAADEADWQAFVLLMGGPMVARADQLVRIGYWHEHNAETGEVVGAGVNRYGEIPEARIYGLSYGQDKHILTRLNTWAIHRPGEEKPAVEITAEVKAERRAALQEVAAHIEWKPWAFDVLDQEQGRGYDPGFRFSGGANAPPLEYCQ